MNTQNPKLYIAPFATLTAMVWMPVWMTISFIILILAASTAHIIYLHWQPHYTSYAIEFIKLACLLIFLAIWVQWLMQWLNQAA